MNLFTFEEYEDNLFDNAIDEEKESDFSKKAIHNRFYERRPRKVLGVKKAIEILHANGYTTEYKTGKESRDKKSSSGKIILSTSTKRTFELIVSKDGKVIKHIYDKDILTGFVIDHMK